MTVFTTHDLFSAAYMGRIVMKGKTKLTWLKLRAMLADKGNKNHNVIISNNGELITIIK